MTPNRNPTPRPCQDCGATFPYWGQRLYCDACRTVTADCLHCGRSFTKRRPRPSERPFRFCSTACQHQPGWRSPQPVVVVVPAVPIPRIIETMTYRAAAEMLGVTEGEVWSLVRDGFLRSCHDDKRRVLLDAESVRGYRRPTGAIRLGPTRSVAA